MRMQWGWWKILLLVGAVIPASGGTFGRVVPIAGMASDVALDEARGVAYVANFTANRIEVVGTGDLTLRTAYNVGPQPGSLALSHDGRYLLVTHFSNFQPPGSAFHGLTLIHLESGVRQTFTLPSPPLGAAFTLDRRALVVTSGEFLVFHPDTGAVELVDTVENVTANTLPAPPPNFPRQIIAASMAVSADHMFVYGLTDTIRFRYDLQSRRIVSLGYTAEPPLGPRVVSVSRDGSYYAAGWALFSSAATLVAQFPRALGLLHVGSHVIDSDRGLIYAQIPENEDDPPVLMVTDADNLTVREE
jgi:DNA-binding beta-propeller fold protein YncE